MFINNYIFFTFLSVISFFLCFSFLSATPPNLAANENHYADEESTFTYRRCGSLLNHILLVYYVIKLIMSP